MLKNKKGFAMGGLWVAIALVLLLVILQVLFMSHFISLIRAGEYKEVLEGVKVNAGFESQEMIFAYLNYPVEVDGREFPFVDLLDYSVIDSSYKDRVRLALDGLIPKLHPKIDLGCFPVVVYSDGSEVKLLDNGGLNSISSYDYVASNGETVVIEMYPAKLDGGGNV